MLTRCANFTLSLHNSTLHSKQCEASAAAVPELGGVELCANHVQGVPANHRHPAEDAGQKQAPGLALDHVDEEHTHTGHQQTAGWATATGDTLFYTPDSSRLETFSD